MDLANTAAPLRSRYDLSEPQGVRAALREIYPPDEAASASFDKLLGRLSNEPSSNGVKSAIRDSYLPPIDLEASFDRLLGKLGDVPGANANGAGK